MHRTFQIAEVHEEACVGCTVCANVCPAGAITMVERLAVVEESRCVGCPKCLEACLPYGAIALVEDPTPKQIGIPMTDWDQPAVDELCAKARLSPWFPICPCNGTSAGEVAAAVVDGAVTPEDLTIATGVRAVCDFYCLAAALRLLAAHGVQLDRPARDYRVYTDTVTEVAIWNITDEVADRFPEHFLREDRAAVEAGRLEPLAGPMYPNIRRRPA